MSNSLQTAHDFARTFVRYQFVSIGLNLEPAISIGNLVRSIILSAPFTWPFNRNTKTFATVVGQQDYPILSFTDFGFLEAASTQDSNGKIFQIPNVYNTLVKSLDSSAGRPQSICVLQNVTSGSPATNNNITFRLLPVPDAIYNPLTLTYQKAPVPFVALADFWTPIPDAFSDIYNQLFIGYAMAACQDPRSGEYIARGGAALLSKSEGLTEMQKAIFMAAYLNLDAAQIISQLTVQRGVESRGK
jgi:hypothetical protein